MLEIFIVLNEKDEEEYQGEGSVNNSKGEERGEKRKNTPTFFFVFFKSEKNAWVASEEALV